MSDPRTPESFLEADAPSLLQTGVNDRYFDYCLEPYQPRTSPVGKLRSENLLWAALEEAGATSLREPLLAIQSALGKDMTVWGVKFTEGRLWLELYFYDPRKEDARATVTGLKEILRPWFDIPPQVPEWVKYMMVSFDLFADSLGQGSVDELNLYLTGTPLHEGRSYKVSATEAVLGNTYRFLPPKKEIDLVLSLVQSSMFVEFDAEPSTLAKVLIPQLFACKRICVAKKSQSDGVYFSGIDVDQFVLFLRRFDYPKALKRFVLRHRKVLDHLYFDVGVDYLQDPDTKQISYPKTSFYGTL